MANFNNLQIGVGIDASQMEAGAAKVVANVQQMKNEIGRDNFTGELKHNLKHAKKELGLAASYIGAFMGSEAASGFKGTFKEIIGGAIGGLMVGGIAGAGIGAILGFGAASIEQYSESKKETKELSAKLNLAKVDARELWLALKSENAGAAFSKIINLIDELRQGTDKAKEAMEGLFKLNPNLSNLDNVKELVKHISEMKGTDKAKAIINSFGTFDEYSSVKAALEKADEEKKKNDAKHYASMHGGFAGSQGYDKEQAEEQAKAEKERKEALEEQKTYAKVKSGMRADKEELNAAEKESEKVYKGQDESKALIDKAQSELEGVHGELSILQRKKNDIEEELQWTSNKNTSGAIELENKRLSIAMDILNVKKREKELIEQQKNIQNTIDDRAKWNNKDLAALAISRQEEKTPWTQRPITGVWTLQGKANVLAARQADNLESWAKRNELEGFHQRAKLQMETADKIRHNIGALTSKEKDPMLSTYKEMDKLNKALAGGEYKIKVANGK